jgi:hypothetical protein
MKTRCYVYICLKLRKILQAQSFIHSRAVKCKASYNETIFCCVYRGEGYGSKNC